MTNQPTYTELYITVQELLKRVNGLEGLVKQNQKLTRENAVLKERLSKYENPKNSRNSSIPPSQDHNRPKPNQSLRKSSGKTGINTKTWGQIFKFID